jgi:hypothetical protein
MGWRRRRGRAGRGGDKARRRERGRGEVSPRPWRGKKPSSAPTVGALVGARKKYGRGRFIRLSLAPRSPLLRRHQHERDRTWSALDASLCARVSYCKNIPHRQVYTGTQARVYARRRSADEKRRCVLFLDPRGPLAPCLTESRSPHQREYFYILPRPQSATFNRPYPPLSSSSSHRGG